MSKREELRKRRQREQRRNQIVIVGVVAVAVVLVAAVLLVPRILADMQPVGEIIAPEATDYSMANGKALGPADARVVIQEFSDFQ
jgi:isochorismate hydrolase